MRGLGDYFRLRSHISKVYDLHRYDAEKREALTRWEGKLMTTIGR